MSAMPPPLPTPTLPSVYTSFHFALLTQYQWTTIFLPLYGGGGVPWCLTVHHDLWPQVNNQVDWVHDELRWNWIVKIYNQKKKKSLKCTKKKKNSLFPEAIPYMLQNNSYLSDMIF